MKVLCIGDNHFRTDNIQTVDIYINLIVEHVRNIKPDLVVFLGDLLDTHEKIHITPFNRACEMIKKISQLCQIYVIVGNHDMASNQEFLSKNHWMNPLKHWPNVVIVDKVIELLTPEKEQMVFVPYVFPGRFKEALCSLNKDWKNAKVIFCHQEFYGAKMGAFNSIDGDIWNIEDPFIISGHIHYNQRVGDNIYYPGSSLQVSYDEYSKKLISLINISEENPIPEIDEIEIIGLPSKMIIHLHIDDFNRKQLPIKHENEQIKICVSGNYEDFKAAKKTSKYKEYIDGGFKVVFKPKKSVIEFNKTTIEENLNEHNGHEFIDVLQKTIEDENDAELTEAFNYVINNDLK